MSEHATVTEAGCTGNIDGKTWLRNGCTWTVRIVPAKPFSGFYVWAECHESGAVVPTESAEDGMSFVPSKDHRKTLAQARDRAGQLANILRGGIIRFDWRKEATRA